MKQNKDIVLIGYSGHSFVVLEIFKAMGMNVTSYCDIIEKDYNPYMLSYLGSENDASVIERLKDSYYFIAIGNNELREHNYNKLVDMALSINAIHPSSIISETVETGNGIMVGAGVIINALSVIGNNVILNTGCVIEHECKIADHVHIAPGAILCGNISVGKKTFVGANAVIKQGVKIGENVIIGAGSVITKDIADSCKIVGNPQRQL